jgi:hypothetical protein
MSGWQVKSRPLPAFDTPEHRFETLPHIPPGILNLTFQALSTQSDSSAQPEETKMKPFIQHPHQQGVTYFEHWIFAMGIAYRLLTSVVAFALHAILPFISIEPHLDLEATAAFLAERNQFIETAAATAHAHPNPAISGSVGSRHDTPALA